MPNLLPQDNYDTYLTAPAGDGDLALYVNELPVKTAGYVMLYDIDGLTPLEKVKYTSIASNPNRLIIPSSPLGRGLSFTDTAGVFSDTGSADRATDHSSGIRVAMTVNVNYIGRVISQLNGDEETGGVMKNPASRTISDPRHLVDMEYAAGLTVSAVPAFLVTQNGADPSLTVNIGAGTFQSGTTPTNFAGASAQAVLANSTNYVQLTSAGAVVINQSSFLAGNIPLAQVVTNANDITSITDRRPFVSMPFSTNTEGAFAGTSGTPSGTNKYVTDADTRLSTTGVISMFAGNTAPTGWLLCNGAAVSRTTYASLFAVLFPTVGTFTVTVASPGLVTQTAHGLATGDGVYLTTTGALPTGLLQNTRYWIIKNDANSYWLATSQAAALAGTKINTSGTQSGVHTSRLAPAGVGDGSTTFNLPSLLGSVPVGKDQSQAEFAGLGQTGGEKTHLLTVAEMPAHTHTGTFGDFTGAAGLSGYAGANRTNSSIATGSTGGDGAHNNLQPYFTINFIIKT